MTKQEQAFQTFVLDWYEKCGRHDLPWRQITDPYLILVSELMLQQTQVARVVPKYEAFVARWPTAALLASAPLGDILRAWQGLGYNRRAKFLHETARVVTKDMAGQFPVTEGDLRKLPGIGPYTASAICAFAYNQPVLLVETNVRQVYIHHFYTKREQVTDVEILSKVARTLPEGHARQWYAALMDYGTYLKSQYGNNTKIVKGYTKQLPFKGSDREVRGAILRALSKSRGARTILELQTDLAPLPPEKINTQIRKLHRDGLIESIHNCWQLP